MKKYSVSDFVVVGIVNVGYFLYRGSFELGDVIGFVLGSIISIIIYNELIKPRLFNDNGRRASRD